MENSNTREEIETLKAKLFLYEQAAREMPKRPSDSAFERPVSWMAYADRLLDYAIALKVENQFELDYAIALKVENQFDNAAWQRDIDRLKKAEAALATARAEANDLRLHHIYDHRSATGMTLVAPLLYPSFEEWIAGLDAAIAASGEVKP